MTSSETPDAPSFAGMALLDAATVDATLDFDGAADALEATLRGGMDPERDGERSRLTTPTGELLLMPSADERFAGIKVLSNTPDNVSRGAPLLQGAYLLFEGPEQRPCAVLDGMALTALRTPAVTLLGLRHLLPERDGGRRAVVIGAGIQGRAHALALACSRHVGLTALTLVGREADRLRATADAIAAAPGALGVEVNVVVDDSGTAYGVDAIAEADIIVTCTPSATPLFDGARVKDDAVVVAMGSHFPTDRETDDALIERAHVVVESRAATLREAGDVMIPIDSGLLDPARITTLRDAVIGTPPPVDRPRFFKFTGMPWEDLAVATGLYEACTPTRH